MKTAILLRRFKKFPLGLWLFSRALCYRAPYFASIRPTFSFLEPGRGEAFIRNRRAVRNHLGTVHAIAMCNLCELVAGTTLEITLPSSHRWIPKGMTVKYLAKATTHLRAVTQISLDNLPAMGSLPILVEVFDRRGKLVMTADIEMHVSQRKEHR